MEKYLVNGRIVIKRKDSKLYFAREEGEENITNVFFAIFAVANKLGWLPDNSIYRYLKDGKWCNLEDNTEYDLNNMIWENRRKLPVAKVTKSVSENIVYINEKMTAVKKDGFVCWVDITKNHIKLLYNKLKYTTDEEIIPKEVLNGVNKFNFVEFLGEE